MNSRNLFIIILAGGLLSSCSQSGDEPGRLAEPVPARFSASIGAPAARASESSWDAGDCIGISANTGSFANLPFVTAAGDGAFSPEDGTISYESTQPVTFTAYYPYSEQGAPISASTADQSRQPDFDFLWAQASGTYADPDVAFTFSHSMSRLTFTVSNSLSLDLAGATLKIEGIVTDGSFDPSTGVATATGAPASLSAAFEDTEASLIVFPQTLEGATLTVMAEGSAFSTSIPAADLLPGMNHRLAVVLTATGLAVSEVSGPQWVSGGSETVTVTTNSY